jgi:hypothetical protein
VGVDGQRHAPAILFSGKGPDTPCIGDLVGLGSGLDWVRKILPSPELDTRAVQPVASRYIDYVVPVHKGTLNLPKIRCPEQWTPKFETVVSSWAKVTTVSSKYLISDVLQPVPVDSRYVSRNLPFGTGVLHLNFSTSCM